MLKGTAFLAKQNGAMFSNTCQDDLIISTSAQEQQIHISPVGGARGFSSLSLSSNTLEIRANVRFYGEKFEVFNDTFQIGKSIIGPHDITSPSIHAKSNLFFPYWQINQSYSKLQFNHISPSRTVLSMLMNGNLGIGTEYPSCSFHVKGQTLLENICKIQGDLIVSGNLIVDGDQVSANGRNNLDFHVNRIQIHDCIKFQSYEKDHIIKLTTHDDLIYQTSKSHRFIINGSNEILQIGGVNQCVTVNGTISTDNIQTQHILANDANISTSHLILSHIEDLIVHRQANVFSLSASNVNIPIELNVAGVTCLKQTSIEELQSSDIVSQNMFVSNADICKLNASNACFSNLHVVDMFALNNAYFNRLQVSGLHVTTLLEGSNMTCSNAFISHLSALFMQCQRHEVDYLYGSNIHVLNLQVQGISLLSNTYINGALFSSTANISNMNSSNFVSKRGFVTELNVNETKTNNLVVNDYGCFDSLYIKKTKIECENDIVTTSNIKCYNFETDNINVNESMSFCNCDIMLFTKCNAVIFGSCNNERLFSLCSNIATIGGSNVQTCFYGHVCMQLEKHLILRNDTNTNDLTLGVSPCLNAGYIQCMSEISSNNRSLFLNPHGGPLGINTMSVTPDDILRVHAYKNENPQLPCEGYGSCSTSGNSIHAFDKDDHSGWTASINVPQAITFIYPNPVYLSSYSIAMHKDPERMPKKHLLKASVDGIIWQTIDFQKDVDWDASKPREFHIKNVVSYFKHFQLYITQVVNRFKEPGIGELRLFTIVPIIINQNGYLGLNTCKPTQALTIKDGSLMFDDTHHETNKSKIRGSAAVFLDRDQMFSLEKQMSYNRQQTNLALVASSKDSGLVFKKAKSSVYSVYDEGYTLMAFDKYNKCAIGSNHELPIYDIDLRGTIHINGSFIKTKGPILCARTIIQFGANGIHGIYKIDNDHGIEFQNCLMLSSTKYGFFFIDSLSKVFIFRFLGEYSHYKEYSIHEHTTKTMFHLVHGVILDEPITVQLFNIGYVLDENNNVGINTHDPSTNMHVNGEGYISSSLFLGEHLAIGFEADDNYPLSAEIHLSNSNSYKKICLFETCNKANEFAGIGFSNNYFNLQVPSNICSWSFDAAFDNTKNETMFKIDGSRQLLYSPFSLGLGSSNLQGFKMYVEGPVFASGGFHQSSDIRLKKNVCKIENALDKLEKISGYTFEYIGQNKTGLIAQEVEKVLPEAVVTNIDNGEKSIAYGNMLGLIVEAIKELRRDVNALKSSVS